MVVKSFYLLTTSVLISLTLAELPSTFSADEMAQTLQQSRLLADRNNQDLLESDYYQDPRLSELQQGYIDNILYDGLLDKRAKPMGFHGMRGKKFDDLYYNDPMNNEKRAPRGFQGLRGKKSSIDELNDISSKRAPMGFTALRGKKDGEEDFKSRYGQALSYRNGMDDPESADWGKRVPLGFQGVRGKKERQFRNLDELAKRALLGFHGMRGKKSFSYQYDDVPEESNFIEKRPQIMGFHGMRGKRSTNFFEME